jgi:hypothetical protein
LGRFLSSINSFLSYAYGMTQTPIAINNINGRPVVGGAELAKVDRERA